MSETRKPSASLYYIIFVGFPFAVLVAFSVYVWNSTEIKPRNPEVVQPSPDGPAVNVVTRITPVLRMAKPSFSTQLARNPAAAIVAELVLRNESQGKVKVLYTPWPSPLLQVKLHYLGPDGQKQPEFLKPVAGADTGSPRLAGMAAGQKYLVTELEQGVELFLPVPLKPPYDLSRAGTYRLEVVYAPEAYLQHMRLNTLHSELYNQTLTPQALEFRVSGEAAAPQENPAGNPPGPEATPRTGAP